MFTQRLNHKIFTKYYKENAMQLRFLLICYCCFVYRTDFTSGNITINGRSRNLKLFRSQAAYIMQNGLLHSHITAWEAMHFSVNLKIGEQLKHEEKNQRVS